MIEGICYKCGPRVLWLGITPTSKSSCPKCGAGLLITEDGKEDNSRIFSFYCRRIQNEIPPRSIPDPETNERHYCKRIRTTRTII